MRRLGLLVCALALSGVRAPNPNTTSCIARVLNEKTQQPAAFGTPDPAAASGYPGQVTQAPDPCGGFSGKKVYIVSDNGLYLARCHGCGPGTAKYWESVTVHGGPGQSYSTWTLIPVSGKCALKTDIGAYAARCNQCWRNSSHPDAVFAHVTDTANAPYAQWAVVKVGDKFAFKADNGKYMARCNNCVPGMAKSNSALVSAGTPEGPALWDIKPAV